MAACNTSKRKARQQVEAMKAYLSANPYRVIWHNDHACGDLGRFPSEAEASRAGENWRHEILAIDPAGDREYVYEVIGN